VFRVGGREAILVLVSLIGEMENDRFFSLQPSWFLLCFLVSISPRSILFGVYFCS
jgi:hypothetical protein